MVATHLVKLACELPDLAGRSLSLWTCAELARTAAEKGLVESISPQSVQRILEGRRLKPWRVHFWLSQKAPLDETDVYKRQVKDDLLHALFGGNARGLVRRAHHLRRHRQVVRE